MELLHRPCKWTDKCLSSIYNNLISSLTFSLPLHERFRKTKDTKSKLPHSIRALKASSNMEYISYIKGLVASASGSPESACEQCAAGVEEYAAEHLAILKAGWASNVKEHLRSNCPALTEDHIYIPLHNSARRVAECHKTFALSGPHRAPNSAQVLPSLSTLTRSRFKH
jgi:hypothetical protein